MVFDFQPLDDIMLDRKFILENVELIKQNCANRGVRVDIDRVVALDAQRKAAQTRVDDLNRRANEVARSIGKAKDPAQREARKEEGRQLRESTVAAQAELDRIEAELGTLLRAIPNLTHPAAPVGMESVEQFRGKTPVPSFGFKPLDHVELGEKLDLMDFEAAARVTGHGFYFLKNEAVLLELALQRYALDILIDEGFTPTTTPDLARNEVLEGIGFIPRGPETQIYSIEGTDLSLVATAEITLGGLLSGQTIDEEALPIKVCGISHCFRTEAGAHGKATRGLFRVHQFTKVEMFAFTRPDESDAMLDDLLRIECRIFDGLGIPYRVIDTASGDLGGPAYRKFDLEAWMPGRGEFGEITSTSNCTDYQARRLNIRCRRKGEKGTRFVHTLNGTAIAISRALVAILENYQQADGAVVVPEVLRPWVGKERIEPRPRA
jgi:seryl-tRNA synthetase